MKKNLIIIMVISIFSLISCSNESKFESSYIGYVYDKPQPIIIDRVKNNGHSNTYIKYPGKSEKVILEGRGMKTGADVKYINYNDSIVYRDIDNVVKEMNLKDGKEINLGYSSNGVNYGICNVPISGTVIYNTQDNVLYYNGKELIKIYDEMVRQMAPINKESIFLLTFNNELILWNNGKVSKIENEVNYISPIIEGEKRQLDYSTNSGESKLYDVDENKKYLVTKSKDGEYAGQYLISGIYFIFIEDDYLTLYNRDSGVKERIVQAESVSCTLFRDGYAYINYYKSWNSGDMGSLIYNLETKKVKEVDISGDIKVQKIRNEDYICVNNKYYKFSNGEYALDESKSGEYREHYGIVINNLDNENKILVDDKEISGKYLGISDNYLLYKNEDNIYAYDMARDKTIEYGKVDIENIMAVYFGDAVVFDTAFRDE